MKNLINKIVVSLLVLSSVSVSASETDNFSLRGYNYPDSTMWLNSKMNSSLDEVANKTKSCNPFELQKNLFQSLGGVFIATIEKWSEENPNAEFLPFENSIYSDIGETPGTHGLRKLVKFKSYYVPGQFRVGDVIAGDDKLGHFLQLGYGMYYAVHAKKNKNFPDIRTPMQRLAEVAADDYKFIRNTDKVSPEDIVGAFAQFQEDGEWGMGATLVKSYGDMAADYAGFLFWSDLTDGKNPYFKCEDNHFSRTRNFKWEEYINTGWDESINCSEFHPSIKNQVLAQIQKRNFGQCPIRPKSCAQLLKTFGPIAKSILHPKCIEAGNDILNQN